MRCVQPGLCSDWLEPDEERRVLKVVVFGKTQLLLSGRDNIEGSTMEGELDGKGKRGNETGERRHYRKKGWSETERDRRKWGEGGGVKGAS